ncbi:hypothetical protein EAG_03645, partial [Camponotus floridanus]
RYTPGIQKNGEHFQHLL